MPGGRRGDGANARGGKTLAVRAGNLIGATSRPTVGSARHAGGRMWIAGLALLFLAPGGMGRPAPAGRPHGTRVAPKPCRARARCRRRSGPGAPDGVETDRLDAGGRGGENGPLARRSPAMKKLLVALLVIALLAAGGAWYFVSYRLDGLIERKIEEAGTQALGTAVTVGQVVTDLRGGALTISEITVANPPGFNNPNAFTLRGIEAAVDYDDFDIRRVIIDRPEIVVEEIGGETNVQKLLAQVEAAPADTGTEAEGDAPVIVIRLFRMNESRATFESEGLDRASTVEVDAVELNNLEGTPEELAAVIAREVIEQVVADTAVQLLKSKAKDKLNELLNRD